METLEERFAAALHRLNLDPMPGELPGGAPAWIRFAVGGEEKVYLGDHRRPNGAYVENAVDRAIALYDALPVVPTLLRMDTDCLTPSLLTRLELPQPEERTEESCFWHVKPGGAHFRKLFREIVRGELDPAGLEWLISSVYFLNPRKTLLFHLYDDRGALVAAPDWETLRPLEETCGPWLLEQGPEKKE